jgi:hypothetical protein
VAEGGGLLNRYTALKPYRGFESHPLRHPPVANPASDPSGAKFSRCFKGVWPDYPNRRDWPEAGLRSLNGFCL